MKLHRHVVEGLIFGTEDQVRFTQDSPVMPDVWVNYGEAPFEPQDLLLTPDYASSAGELSRHLRALLDEERRAHPDRAPHDLVYTHTFVAVRLYFDELIRFVLPMTKWWHEYMMAEDEKGDNKQFRINLDDPQRLKTLAAAIERALAPDASREQERADARGQRAGKKQESPADEGRGLDLPDDLVWMIRIVGSIAWARQQDPPDEDAPAAEARDPEAEVVLPTPAQMLGALAPIVAHLAPPTEKPMIWAVNHNRTVKTAVQDSALAIKADAARLLFDVTCQKLAWGIVDSGIDARHPAFWRDKWAAPGKRDDDPREDEDYDDWAQYTRVKATYDFTRIRTLLNPSNLDDPAKLPEGVQELLGRDAARDGTLREQLRELRQRLLVGRSIDWELLDPLLQIPHDDDYEPPVSEHGTHVAGILAADWPQGGDDGLYGICPDINLYDFRVVRPGAVNDEFNVLAALQFIDYLNGKKDFYAIHGVNLSLSIHHDVANFACGRTPVCEECERLVASGVVAVAAAGNAGYLKYLTFANNAQAITEGYHTVSITDPGNAEHVITVGATHRSQPHTYGVSYFSSRGPTGDGRHKPDIVAPGEKITAPVPGFGTRRKDGTSMAAPHVSGAAALLMARHAELVGQPGRIKAVLCETATDLGRERYFQGAGMLDVLRALQAV